MKRTPMMRTPLATAVAALIAASVMVAFASDLQTRDDCLEFHKPHHRVHLSLRKKSGNDVSASSSVGRKLQAKSISELKPRHSRSTMKKLRARKIYARYLKRKKGYEAETNRQRLELSRERERTKREANHKRRGPELSRETERAKQEANRKSQGLEFSRDRERAKQEANRKSQGPELSRESESAKQEANRKSQERTNELAQRAAEGEEMNRKAAEARIQAAEARVQGETQKRRLEKAYLDSLSPAERRARNTCRPVYAQYNRVETGMDLDQVQQVFDCNGKEVAQTEEFGSVTTFRSFGDLTKGGLVIVFFLNGRVTTKSQIGLRVESGET
jgi:hypothetical protein